MSVTTSGTVSFDTTAQYLIRDALILIGVRVPAESVDSYTYEEQILERMLKAWSADNTAVWARSDGTLFLAEDQSRYVLHSEAGNDGGTRLAFQDYKGMSTYLTADSAASDTTLVVNDLGRLAASDYIYINLDDGTRDTTTVSSINSSTKTITIASGVTSAASTGARVYGFTSATDEVVAPLHIKNVRVQQSDGNEIRLRELSREEYAMIPDKDTEGLPTCYYFKQKRLQLSPELYVWPVPSNSIDVLKFDYQRLIEDMTDDTYNLEFPATWEEAIVYNLAVRLAPIYGREQKLQVIAPMAQKFYDEIIEADNEDTSINFRPGMYE